MLVNFMTQEAIDILPNRFKTDLIRYFKSIPSLERANVKAVAMDMYPVYRDVVKECFGPKTLCVIDRFHLVKEFNAQVDRIRLSVQRSALHERDSTQARIRRLKEKSNFQSQEIQEEYRKLKAIHDEASDRYYLLSKYGSWMIFKHHNDNCFDENAEKKYNSHFQRYMNFAEIRRMLFELEPLLEQASQYQGCLRSSTPINPRKKAQNISIP